MKINYEVYTFIYSAVFDTNYSVGKTEDGKYVYVWTKFNPEELTQDMIDFPECDHGAMIGTLDEIVDEIEECVGGFVITETRRNKKQVGKLLRSYYRLLDLKVDTKDKEE